MTKYETESSSVTRAERMDGRFTAGLGGKESGAVGSRVGQGKEWNVYPNSD